MKQKKLTGIVNEADLLFLGCMKTGVIAGLEVYECETHAYLVKRHGKKYRIVLGYVRNDIRDMWR